MHVLRTVIFVSMEGFPEVREWRLEALDYLCRHFFRFPLAEIVIDVFPSQDSEIVDYDLIWYEARGTQGKSIMSNIFCKIV